MAGPINWFSQIASITKFGLLSLPQRRGAVAATVIGIAGVVAVLVGVLSIAAGFRQAMTVSGSPDGAIILRSGADSEMVSGFGRDETRVIADTPGIARTAQGPLASAELFVIIDLPKRSTGTDANVPLRGVEPAALLVRDNLKIVQGRMFDWGFDIDESMDPGQAATAQAYQTTGDHREGLFYSTRIEYTLFSDSGKKALYHEDYQGKPGHSLMLTADIGYDNSDYGLANDKVNAYCYGFEALYHLNGLSVLVEGRAMHTKESAYDAAGVNNNILSEVFCAQAGYAFPAMGITIEPAIRWQKLNLDSQHDEQASYNSAMTTGNGSAAVANSATTSALPKWLATYGGADAYNSGNVIDIGVNWIFTPYTLLQTAYTRWNGQTGQNGVHPDANIIRAQFQLYF